LKILLRTWTFHFCYNSKCHSSSCPRDWRLNSQKLA